MRQSTSANWSWCKAVLRRAAILLALAILLSPLGEQANAALLNLDKTIPDINTNPVHVIYTASTKTMTVTGEELASILDVDGTPPPDDYALDGPFSLTITLSDTLGTLQSGSLLITGGTTPMGSEPIIPDPPGPLLAGDVTAFGFKHVGGSGATATAKFEFVVSNLTGDLAGDGVGDQPYHFWPKTGIILSVVGFKTAALAFPPSESFAADFESKLSGSKTDLFPVPEPASGMLALLGLLAVRFFGRRRDS